MHLLWKRYARTGYAPGWFYTIATAAFVALAVWAVDERDWVVVAMAVAMVVASFAGGRMMRRLGEGLAESSRRVRSDVEPRTNRGTADDEQGST